MQARRLTYANVCGICVQADKASAEAGKEPNADTAMSEAHADAAVAAAADGDRDGHSPTGNAGNAGNKGNGGETVYEKFMCMLVDLVEGALDTSKFEDDCRMLLGTNSYELYTLEKVVEKLLVQVLHLALKLLVYAAFSC